MRLLYLTAETYPTHRVDVELLFGKWMSQHGVASDLVAVRTEGAAGDVAWGGGRALLAASRRGWRLRAAATWHALQQLMAVRRGRYDAIQVRDMPFIALFGWLAARAHGLPFLYWMSFPIPESHLGMARDRGLGAGIGKFAYHYANGQFGKWLLYKFLLPRADHVFVQSEQMKTDVAALGVPVALMTPVPMGVDFQQIETAHLRSIDDPRLAGRRVLVYLGTQGRPRRIEVLFEMLALVRREVPAALLVLVGDVDDAPHRDWLRRQADAAGVAEHVLWTGWLPMTEGWRYVRAAEIGLSPFPRGYLLDSSSPTKVPEYLALGVPVVCNDNPDQAAIIAASGAGRCVPYTGRDFADAVIELLRLQAPARREMAMAGRRNIAAVRDYRIISQGLADVYHRVVAGR
jgi:glycosyltransferase involved in cell wall biosynthesis